MRGTYAKHHLLAYAIGIQAHYKARTPRPAPGRISARTAALQMECAAAPAGRGALRARRAVGPLLRRRRERPAAARAVGRVRLADERAAKGGEVGGAGGAGGAGGDGLLGRLAGVAADGDKAAAGGAAGLGEGEGAADSDAWRCTLASAEKERVESAHGVGAVLARVGAAHVVVRAVRGEARAHAVRRLLGRHGLHDLESFMAMERRHRRRTPPGRRRGSLWRWC
jgi:hypothetical protein